MAHPIDVLMTCDGMVRASMRGKRGKGAHSAKLYFYSGKKFLAVYVKTLDKLPRLRRGL